MSDVIVWPSFLPRPQAKGYVYNPVDRRAKTDMEVGGRYRVLFDSDETVIECKVILDKRQLAFFESFEKHLLHQGVTWFEMPVFSAGVVEKHTVRFKERPKFGNFIGLHTTVELVLDVKERKTLDELSTWFLYWFGLDGIKLVNRLHEVLHVEAPGVTIIPEDVRAA